MKVKRREKKRRWITSPAYMKKDIKEMPVLRLSRNPAELGDEEKAAPKTPVHYFLETIRQGITVEEKSVGSKMFSSSK